MLFVPPSSLDSAEEVCGDYTRERLEAMDAAFVAAVELAFAKGGGEPRGGWCDGSGWVQERPAVHRGRY